MDRGRKTLSIELKADGPEGSFRATFATFNVIDKDGDVTLPGAFTAGQEVRIAQWGHNWGALPVGKGMLGADADRAWVDGQFFLDTAAGADTHTTVKALGALQEWSYGYEVLEASFGQQEGKDVRFLRKLSVFEVSPVMLGAGIDTRTEYVKGLTLADESAMALAAMRGFVERATALAATRAKEGRVLSQANRERLQHHLGALAEMRADIETLLAETDPKAALDVADLRKELMRFELIRARGLGVAV